MLVGESQSLGKPEKAECGRIRNLFGLDASQKTYKEAWPRKGSIRGNTAATNLMFVAAFFAAFKILDSVQINKEEKR